MLDQTLQAQDGGNAPSFEKRDQGNEQDQTYQSTDTTSRTVLIDNPKLGVYLKGIEDYIDILRVGVFQLLQHFDLMHGDLNAVIFLASIDFVVVGVNINDFKGNNPIFRLVKTRE